MKKIVCYSMTRNLYPHIGPSLKSLLKNGNVDEVYLLIEDDEIGIWHPDNVHFMNVSGQYWFRPDGPNYECGWTWMVMMKTVLCRLFPQESRIMSIDLDTIVLGDLSALWYLDMDRYCVAGAREPYWTEKYGRDYVNCGVLMWNLDKMRYGRSDQLVKALNRKKYSFVEQDCINEQLAGEILVMDSAYNSCRWTDPPQSDEKLIHFAAYGLEAYLHQPIVKEYAALSWSEVIA